MISYCWRAADIVGYYSLLGNSFYIIIAERISTRHWITNCGPGIGSCMYMYVQYVCLSRFWNAIKAPRMHDGNSICIIFVCMSA